MLRPASEYRGLSLEARDGEIGTVTDLLFDDSRWVVRYLVVDTGTVLPGRRVLLSPLSAKGVDWTARRVHLDLTIAQVKNSPDIETEQPVSREQQRREEEAYHSYYGLPFYWGGLGVWGATVAGSVMPPAAAYLPEPEPGAEPDSGRADALDEGDRHVRSATEVTDYRIEARDGDIGHVEDFLVDDEDWAIRYMVVDTRNWWIGRKVLVAPQWIEAVRWRDRHVGVDLTRDQIKAAPDYDWTRPPARDYEERLHGSYGREGYWAPGADTRTFRPRRRA